MNFIMSDYDKTVSVKYVDICFQSYSFFYGILANFTILTLYSN